METEMESVVVETAPNTFESAEFAPQADLDPTDYLIEEEHDETDSETASETASDESREDSSEVADAEDAPEGEDSGEGEQTAIEKRLAELEAQVQLREIYDSVGGQEAYKALSAKASETLSPDLLEAYDEIVTAGTLAEAKFAVAALQAMVGPLHTEASATYGGAQPTAENSFKDSLDFMEALKDPRYNVDPLFTQSVVDKLANSPHVSL